MQNTACSSSCSLLVSTYVNTALCMPGTASGISKLPEKFHQKMGSEAEERARHTCSSPNLPSQAACQPSAGEVCTCCIFLDAGSAQIIPRMLCVSDAYLQRFHIARASCMLIHYHNSVIACNRCTAAPHSVRFQ